MDTLTERAQTARTAQSLAADDAGRAVELAAVTDRGSVRNENQDAAAVLSLDAATGCALLLADGMGGHPDGRLAATLAVETAGAALRAAEEPVGALPGAVAAANQAILSRSAPDERGRSLGTTLVAAVICGGRATVANVGDSRGYLVRGGLALQITVDHSWVAEQVRAGLLSAEEAGHHPRRSSITRALLGEPVEADMFEVNLRPGDVVLLCSDGLWEALAPRQIAEIVEADGPLEERLAALVDAALLGGSTDNVTAAAARV